MGGRSPLLLPSKLVLAEEVAAAATFTSTTSSSVRPINKSLPEASPDKRLRLGELGQEVEAPDTRRPVLERGENKDFFD